MSDIAIRVEGLSKQYQIGGAQGRYQTLREAILRTAAAPVRWARGERQENNTIWALDDVSFEVKQGEVIGVIGRNGAGKSTLLKILSRITKPTRGRVELNGRVGSLLEVGTGFHPELTGRENIFLNGAILGMTRREIQRKFDEIVDFSGVEKFIDTPVKRYSSGMQVRLAFSVAAHLEPEILLVDEVLAVGDAEFQKKSLGKMDEVSKTGRTVLFVSHNMGAVRELCTRGIVFDEGRIWLDSDPSHSIDNYFTNQYSSNIEHSDLRNLQRKNSDLGSLVRITKCYMENSEGSIASKFKFGEPFKILIESLSKQSMKNLDYTVRIESNSGTLIAYSASSIDNLFVNACSNEKIVLSAEIENFVLVPGHYRLTLSIREFDQLEGVIPFEILSIPHKETKKYSGLWGYVRMSAKWRIKT